MVDAVMRHADWLVINIAGEAAMPGFEAEQR
jgi:hypothetical protein